MNHVVAVFKNQGVVAGFKKLADVVEAEFESLETEFPVLAEFSKQFASDFGKKVLADAATLAPQVIAKTVTITDAAVQLVEQAAKDGLAIAQADATTIALNALRVHVTALEPPAVPSAEPSVAPAEAPTGS